jgi:biotin carboxyl carrier protein
VSILYRRPGGDVREVTIEAREGDAVFVECGDLSGEFRVEPLGAGRFRLHGPERVWSVCVDARGACRAVTIEGAGEARLDREASGRRRGRDSGGGGLTSPMPGTVVKVLVAVGDRVVVGQDLLVVEAMKMETKISTSVAGTVRALNVAEGDSCDAGVTLAEVEPEASS